MKFGPVPLADAHGHINAHSVDVWPNVVEKGALITDVDIARMQDEGMTHVTVAQLGPDDLHEDAAAFALAQSLVPNPAAAHLKLTVPKTGRVNVIAAAEGVVTFDPAAIHRFNDVNPMITIATVPPFHRLAPGGMVATIKIIAYGIPKADVETAMKTGASLQLAVGQYASATLIETAHSSRAPNDKGRRSLAARLAPLGTQLSPRCVTTHKIDALSEAIRNAPGDVIFILTASATSDAHDVAPSALRHAGGTVTRFGMPVDPGNLLFIGTHGQKPVIGLPGCARSPALNGADWVLNRLLCGVPVSSSDIAAMGVGGLLKEIPTRPRPRNQ